MKIGDTATIEMFLKYGPLGMQLKRDYRDGYLCYSAEAASELSEEDIEYYSSCCLANLPFVPGFIGVDCGEYKVHLHSGWGCVRDGDWKISKLPTIPLLKRKTT